MVDQESSRAADTSPGKARESGAMRTERLFWADPYATRSEACVVAVEGNEVALDRTVFFAFSGGQESDYGTIAGLAVQRATLDGQRILYTLPDDHGLALGQNVVVEIDRGETDGEYGQIHRARYFKVLLDFSLGCRTPSPTAWSTS